MKRLGGNEGQLGPLKVREPDSPLLVDVLARSRRLARGVGFDVVEVASLLHQLDIGCALRFVEEDVTNERWHGRASVLGAMEALDLFDDRVSKGAQMGSQTINSHR